VLGGRRLQGPTFFWLADGAPLQRRASSGRLGRMRLKLRADIADKTRRALDRAKSSSWYEWFARHYWSLSDKLADKAQQSRFWSLVSAGLRVQPKDLALGFAEGTILFKFTVLIHAPLELWLIVKLFKQHRAMLTAAAAPEVSGEHVPTTEVEAAGDALTAASLQQNFSRAQRVLAA